MPELKLKMSAAFSEMTKKTGTTYNPKFEQNNEDRVEKNLDILLRDEQVKQAMVLLADA